jgi:hypothetical protein
MMIFKAHVHRSPILAFESAKIRVDIGSTTKIVK